MKVKLHPFLRRCVHFGFLFTLHHRKRLQHHIAGKTVNVQLALNVKVLAFLHTIYQGFPLITGKKFIDTYRTGIVCHIKGDHPGAPLFQFPVVHREDIALHNDSTHVQIQAAHGNGLLFDLMTAIKEFSFPVFRGFLLCGPGGLQIFQRLAPDLLRPPEGGGRLILRLWHFGGGRCGLLRDGYRRSNRSSLLLNGDGKFQFHLLHPIGQGQTTLDLPAQLLRRRICAFHLGLDRSGVLVDDRTGDLIVLDYGHQLHAGTPGGKQLEKWDLLCFRHRTRSCFTVGR